MAASRARNNSLASFLNMHSTAPAPKVPTADAATPPGSREAIIARLKQLQVVKAKLMAEGKNLQAMAEALKKAAPAGGGGISMVKRLRMIAMQIDENRARLAKTEATIQVETVILLTPTPPSLPGSPPSVRTEMRGRRSPR